MPCASARQVSQAQIRALLEKKGANRFMFMEEPDKATVMFFLDKLLIKIMLPYPDDRFSASARDRLVRSRWRVLLMMLRMRFEAAEAKISTIEEQFIGDIVTPDGATTYEWLRPQITRMVMDGRMPKTMLAIEGPRS